MIITQNRTILGLWARCIYNTKERANHEQEQHIVFDIPKGAV